MSPDTLKFWALLVLAVFPWVVVFRALIQLGHEQRPQDTQADAAADGYGPNFSPSKT